MAGIRVTGQRAISKTPGTTIGLQVNTFVMDKLASDLSGELLQPIAVEALTPALFQCREEWPVLTGASKETIRVETVEVTAKAVRVALVVGGLPLIEDPRNKSHKDYAPFIELNGTATTPAGTLTHAMVMNESEMRAYLHDRARALLEELTRG